MKRRRWWLISSAIFLPLVQSSHRQDDAELCVAAEHARVSLRSLFERICLNHRAHAGQLGEAQRVLGIGRRPRGPALNRPTPRDELYRRDLDGMGVRAYDQEIAVRAP